MNKSAYKIEINGLCSRLLELLLISILISIIPLLLSTENNAIFYTSIPFYITIVITLWCLIYYRFWGIIISFTTFAVCGVLNNLPINILIINSIINTLQALLILLGYLLLHKIKIKNDNRYYIGIFYLSKYNFFIVCMGIIYSIYSLFFSENQINILLFSLVIFIVTLIKVVHNKDVYLLLFLFFISLFPSLISSVLSALTSQVPQEIKLNYIVTWSLSNFILLQTFGYCLFQLLFLKRKKSPVTNTISKINVSTVVYYIALFVWNILIIYLYKLENLNVHAYIYFFPWILGNILLGFNLYFSTLNDNEIEKNNFSWFENRVIVVEKNTSTIITIIAFLLPFSTSFLIDMPKELLSLFIANIFCACLSIGLIWVPSTNIRFIALLKSVKTVFYLYSIGLLLISSIVIVFRNG